MKLVFIENNRPVTDSLAVAETFGKRHDRVLQDIRELECSKEFNVHNFVEVKYIDSRNRKYPKFLITHDGFSFLVMGYTGKEAARFKEMYIGEFNRMRDELNKPKSQLEILQASVNQLVEQERRLSAVEKRQDQITEVLSLNPTEWRKKVNALINKIAQQYGGHGAYPDVRNESYQILEDRAGCKLSIRLTNKQRKMALEGVQKSKIDKANKMDVIADDARLTEIYLAIVKEMAIKNQVDAKEVDV